MKPHRQGFIKQSLLKLLGLFRAVTKKMPVMVVRFVAFAGAFACVGLVFLVWATGLLAVEKAFFLALAYLLGVLLLFSFWAGRMSGLSRAWSLAFSTVTLLIGVLVILLKYKFGH